MMLRRPLLIASGVICIATAIYIAGWYISFRTGIAIRQAQYLIGNTGNSPVIYMTDVQQFRWRDEVKSGSLLAQVTESIYWNINLRISMQHETPLKYDGEVRRAIEGKNLKNKWYWGYWENPYKSREISLWEWGAVGTGLKI